MFVFVCHKAKKQAIHHVLKRTCFLARFQKTPVDLTQKNPDLYGTNKVPSLANIPFP